jgi:hypothetical protein
MRHGKGVDLQIAKAEAGAGFKDLPAWLAVEGGLHGAHGRGVGENLQVGKPREPGEPDRVVAVVMGDEHSVDGLQLFPGLGEQRTDATGGVTGVDEHPCLLGLQEGAVAGTAAGENAKLHGSDRRVQRAAPRNPQARTRRWPCILQRRGAWRH